MYQCHMDVRTLMVIVPASYEVKNFNRIFNFGCCVYYIRQTSKSCNKSFLLPPFAQIWVINFTIATSLEDVHLLILAIYTMHAYHINLCCYPSQLKKSPVEPHPLYMRLLKSLANGASDVECYDSMNFSCR